MQQFYSSHPYNTSNISFNRYSQILQRSISTYVAVHSIVITVKIIRKYYNHSTGLLAQLTYNTSCTKHIKVENKDDKLLIEELKLLFLKCRAPNSHIYNSLKIKKNNKFNEYLSKELMEEFKQQH
uniref:Uncharacterized protein n=1 Tax=Rhizophagus irregularis (strain DAOM 181602 / DAOM 197198 / MUCL 43194) TaxID=747089 RepID=U9SPT4_RHIID